MNPRHARKLTAIEDFVTILPTSAESSYQNLENQSSDAYLSSQSQANKEDTINVQDETLLAITDGSEPMLAINADLPKRHSA